jgi:LacI family transcriptional regulator
MKNITIKDIAKESGVSVATVSRVINNNPTVAPELRQKVLATIEENGYYPNLIARGLKKDSTQTIAIVIADGNSNEYFSEIIKSIENVIRMDNYTLFVCNSLNEKDTELNYLNLLAEKQVDGIIVNASGFNNEYIAKLSKHIPMVLLHRRINLPNFKGDFIDADFGSSCYELTMDLIEKGHRKIGLISGPLFLSSASDRFVGFKRAMKSIDVDVTTEYKYFFEDSFTIESGYAATEKLLNMEDPPTALIIMHSDTTIGALRYFRSHNISVPQDISFASPCNISIADLLYVQPNYAMPDTWSLGKRVGEMLMERIKCGNEILNREVCYVPNVIYGNSVKNINLFKGND